MKKVENLQDLLIDQSRQLYSSNEQALNTLPSIEAQVTSSDLKKIINKEISSTQDQQTKLKTILGELKSDTIGAKCDTTEAILNETKRHLKDKWGAGVRDAGIVNSLQQLGHIKVAHLGSTAAYAREIGREPQAKILGELFETEKRIGKELIDVATKHINKKAVGQVVA